MTPAENRRRVALLHLEGKGQPSSYVSRKKPKLGQVIDRHPKRPPSGRRAELRKRPVEQGARLG